ncbi:MAG: metal ABC transporter substrate-binding protein [Dethiobacteria bacterium]
MKSLRGRCLFYLLIMICICIAVLTAGCQYKYGTNPDKENKMSIVTTIFPIADIIRNIGGDYVHVTCLLPPGADPHTFEPTVAQVKAMARTDLFVYIGNGLDDWSLKLSAAADRDLSIVRLSENMELAASPSSPHDHNCKESNNIYCTHGNNPHIWLDPVMVRDHIIMVITRELSRSCPQGKTCFAENSNAYRTELTKLDKEINDRLFSLENRSFISCHSAWAYFAARYGLEEAAVISEHPGQEPSPRWIAELVDLTEALGISTIFAESQLNPALAESIAAEIDGRVLLLDPLGGEGLPGRGSYLELMRHNTAIMAEGLKE